MIMVREHEPNDDTESRNCTKILLYIVTGVLPNVKTGHTFVCRYMLLVQQR